MRVPYLDLRAENEPYLPGYHRALDELWAQNQYILGPEVEAFETAYAAWLGIAHCVGVGNATDALFLILRCLDIGPGHEVIVPGYTCLPTWLAVSHTGAVPIPCEVHPETLTMDPSRIAALCNERTRAIIVVHMCGVPADMGAIAGVATDLNLPIVEDNAQATGARFGGMATGTLSVAAAHSFYPTKNLGALGDGGAITTSDPNMAHLLGLLRNYGAKPGSPYVTMGYNSRLDGLQARFLSLKLARLDEAIAHRRALGALYHDGLRDIGDLLVQRTPPGGEWAPHLLTVRTRYRQSMINYLRRHHIGTAIHYPMLPHQNPVYASERTFDLPGSDALSETILSLPMGGRLPLDAASYVVDKIGMYFRSGAYRQQAYG